MNGEWVVLLGVDDRESYSDPEAWGTFPDEDACYAFAAQRSQRPNDWLPLKLKDPADA